MRSRPPAKARRVTNQRPIKARAWRVTDQHGSRPVAGTWSLPRVLLLVGAVALLIGGVGALYAASSTGRPAPAKSPSPVAARDIVSSTISGQVPTVTPTPLAVTPPPAIGGSAPAGGSASQAADAQPRFTPAPPVAVQQVSPPASGAAPAPSSAPPNVATRLAASPAPASSLPGQLQPPASDSGRSDNVAADIQQDLNAINATATALAGSAGPPPSGAARGQTPAAAQAAPTDTPIPTAAPPSLPSA